MIKIRTTGSADYGDYINMLVTGLPGVGKTRFAVTAPNCLLLNAESGTMSIPGVKAIDIEDIETLHTVRAILALEDGDAERLFGMKIETVIVDTIDEVSRLLIRDRLAAEHRDTMEGGDWTWLADQLSALTSAFRKLPYNVIFTCHLKDDDNRADGEQGFKLDISGAGGHQMPGAFDINTTILKRSDPDGGPAKRFLWTDNVDSMPWLKDRSGKLPAAMELNFKDDFQRICDMIFKEVEFDEVPEVVVNYEPPVEKVVASGDPLADMERREALAAQTLAAAQAPKSKSSPTPAPTPGSTNTQPKPSRATVEPPVLTSEAPPSELNVADYDDGARVPMEKKDGLPPGFEIAPGPKPDAPTRLNTIAGLRWVYLASNGEKVVSRNQMAEGVRPVIADGDTPTELYCQETGVPVTDTQADLSRIRFRAILSRDAMEARAELAKHA